MRVYPLLLLLLRLFPFRDSPLRCLDLSVASISSCSYYLVLLVDFTDFCWTFPLRRKSEVHQVIVDFIRYVRTQFGLPIKCFQADNE
jgi:hypothetical protein